MPVPLTLARRCPVVLSSWAALALRGICRRVEARGASLKEALPRVRALPLARALRRRVPLQPEGPLQRIFRLAFLPVTLALAPTTTRPPVSGTGIASKRALTERASFIASLQLGEVSVQAPDQPAKLESSAGVAVRVTLVAAGTVAPAPQVVATGLGLILPGPLPGLVTGRV